MSESDNPTETVTTDSTPEPAELFYGKSETEAEPTTTEPTAEVTPDEEPEVDGEESNDIKPETTEESDETKATQDPEYSDEELFVDLDGREVNLKQIKEWEQGSLRQADYTKKTQTLADDRREFESDRDGIVNNIVSKKLEALDENVATLEALIDEADKSIDWEELREYDLGEYTKQKELKEKREQAVTDARSKRSQVSQEDNQEQAKLELNKLVSNNPEWIKDGKETEVYQKDMTMVINYLNGLNYSEADQKGILTSGHGQIFIDAARYRQSLEKVEKVKKKVVKIPVTTKPRKTGVVKAKSAEEVFYGTS